MSLDLEPINELHRKIKEKLSRMLKPSELRIGNNLWPRRVLDPENTRITGYSICAKHLAYSEEELNHDWEGIPLTPEILKKCGFETFYGCLQKGNLGLSPEAGGYLPLFSSRDDWEPNGSPTIKYLHQLQNLFFALTGEELIVKL